MATVVGPWQGSSPNARIEIDYTVTRSADGTSATMNGTVILATNFSIVDTTNGWEVWGDAGSASGSNVNFNHGGSGGRTGFCGISAGIGPGGMNVGGRVSRLEGPGATIEAVLHLDGVSLAPYSDSTYYAQSITATSFKSANVIVNTNGGNMVDIQMQVNTSQSETGSWTYQQGSWQDVTATGLARATLYYFRIRVANNTYGWGPWGAWKSVTTAKTVPSAPYGYSATSITQVSARSTNSNVADNGGATLTNLRAQINTTPSETNATLVSSGSWADITFQNLIPGTSYSFRLSAGNEVGWSDWGPWVSFTTLPGVLVKYGGTWHNAIPYVKVNGVWVTAIRYVKVGGTWR